MNNPIDSAINAFKTVPHVSEVEAEVVALLCVKVRIPKNTTPEDRRKIYVKEVEFMRAHPDVQVDLQVETY